MSATKSAVSPTSRDLRARAKALPDAPGWIDFRGMLLSGKAAVRGTPRDYVITYPDYRLCAVVGRPEAALLARSLQRVRHLICRDASEPHVAPLLKGWTRTRALLHTRFRSTLTPPAGDVRVVASTRDLRRIPEPLRSELRRNLSRCPMVAAYVGDRPVSIAAACWQTEKWFDISIDTLKPFRRLGFATQSARGLIAEMKARGRSPVWGAAEDNPASLGLAKKLGFRPVDWIWVFTRRR